MKITKVTVVRGKKVNLDMNDTEKFEIQMDAVLDDQDDAQDIVQGLKSILDRHLLAWEQKLQGKMALGNEPNPVTIKTAEELVASTSDEVETRTEPTEPKIEAKTSEEENLNLICPICNEIMVKKEGKDYYLCSKHWGYPDMIRKGQVREKKF